MASIRELVEQIDAHAEPEDTEATSILTVQELFGEDSHFPLADQPEATKPARPSSRFSYSPFMLSLCFYHISNFNGLFA